ncbi:hypothetical protein ID866_7792 [Astraeus odoratus]|nr:hypothetical protein ID866_7792 [Astraeus odoratus]
MKRIMGPTGSGKSSFINKATGNADNGVGRELTSFTSEIKVFKCIIDESPVILIDTPGFDDAERSNLEILQLICDWLDETDQKGALLSAVLYFHRISDGRVAGTTLKNLRVFEKLCGKKAMSRIVFVTTIWDEVEETIGKKRLEELERSYWKGMIARGSVSFKYENSSESAKQLLRHLIDKKRMQDWVLLRKEISVLRMQLRETDAGQELCSRLEQLAERRLEVLQRLRTEREREVSNARTAEDLRREYDELKVQLDTTVGQVQALGLSRKQRTLTAFRKAFSCEFFAPLSFSSPS